MIPDLFPSHREFRLMRANSVIQILLVLSFLTAAISCTDGEPGQKTASHLMVNYTSETGGELFPCGCRIPLGGLSRRAGVLASESPYPQITVDAGSFAGGNTGYDRFVAGWILRAYVEMGYNAINLGIRETSIPVNQLREWDQQAGGILISANLLDQHDLPVTRRSLVRELDGLKIGITGITMEGRTIPGATEVPIVIDPVAPLQEVLSEFENSNVDLVILLADYTSENLEMLLSQISGFDLIVQGRDFTSAPPVESTVLADGTRIVRMGEFGKYLGRIRLDFGDNGEIVGDEVIHVSLDSNTPTRSDISILLTDFRLELQDRREEFLDDPTNPFEKMRSVELIDVLSGFTGMGFCTPCHQLYGHELQATGHSFAWNILDEENLLNSECLQCHTTGYGYPTGMEDPFRDSHLQGVQCESCHGPGAEHVREQYIIAKELDPSSMIPFSDPIGLPFTLEVPEVTCLTCHTEEWSPDFDFETYYPRILHTAAHEAGTVRVVDPESGEESFAFLSGEYPDLSEPE